MSNREGDLLASGFQRVTTIEVAVPHFIWKAELDIEFDRPLRLAESAILTLVDAGIRDPGTIAELLGLKGEPIVPRYLADLMIKGMITRREQLELTAVGRNALLASTAREERMYNVELRHDPYRDELRWELEGELRAHQIEEQGPRLLPTPAPLTHTEFEAHHREIQELISRDGLPFLPDEKVEQRRKRELLRVRPAKYYVSYRPAELEVWHRQESDELRWRLLRGGGEERAISERLTEMEREGVTIIPFEEARPRAEPENDVIIRTAVEIAVQAQKASPAASEILHTADHRPALAQAIQDARSELIIVSPWLRHAAVDQELVSWFRESLERNKKLKIVIGFGIADDPNAGRAGSRHKQQSHEEALRRLREVAQRAQGRLRLVDLGNTHQKVVVVDESYIIVTSFNFLSFKPMPGKVLRQETGARITDPETVRKLKKDLVKLFVSRLTV